MARGVSVKVKINKTAQIIKDHGLDENGRVTRFLRDKADELMIPFIPRESGNLRKEKVYPSASEIKYISPYAHYQYTGKKAKGASRPLGVKRKISGEKLKYHTPGTGSKWDKLMMDKRKKDLINDVQDYIRKGG